MLKRISSSIKIQFLVIALSLSVIALTLSLSAYLTDTQTYQAYLYTVANTELGFTLSGNEVTDSLIEPGDDIELNVTASITRQKGACVFVKFDIPADFIYTPSISSGWYEMDEYPSVYYYGSAKGELKAIDPTNSPAAILSGITLSEEAAEGSEYDIIITGYAIQADYELLQSSPASVYKTAGGE